MLQRTPRTFIHEDCHLHMAQRSGGPREHGMCRLRKAPAVGWQPSCHLGGLGSSPRPTPLSVCLLFSGCGPQDLWWQASCSQNLADCLLQSTAPPPPFSGGPLPTLLCPACRFAQPPPARHDLCQRGRGRAGRTGAPGGLGDENARGLRRRHPFWWEADQAAPRGLRHVGRAKRTWREEPRGALRKRGAAPRRPALHVPSGAFLVIPVISQISFWYLTWWRQPGISITNNSPAF